MINKYGKILLRNVLGIAELFIIGLTVVLMVYVFAAQPLRVTGSSMLPNFFDSEQIIAEKLSVKFEAPKRGDIVICKHPNSPDKLVIKRLIGLPSETIKIKEGLVYINNNILAEPYLAPNTTTKPEKSMEEGVEYKIPEGSFMVMGDNRTNSVDSRDWGPISADYLIGKGLFIYYPLSKIGFIN
ncbi:MAG: Signal peptidase I [uncultured bacterium]|nr:MAG: Signal peptidase I [uncultured bacterium]